MRAVLWRPARLTRWLPLPPIPTTRGCCARWCMRSRAAPCSSRCPVRRPISPRSRAGAASRRAVATSAPNRRRPYGSSCRSRPSELQDVCSSPRASVRRLHRCRPDHRDTRMTTELVHLSATEAGRLLRARKISPVDLVDAFLARIERVDGKIKSYLLVAADGARAKAKAAEAEIMRGRWRGPLHGIPYGAKDTFYTKGLRTCANSRVLLDLVPDYDAAILEKLDAAGAILLGKLNTWEYGTGLGLVYHDAAFAHATNPWKDNYFTGGSSTGSGAAVAAGTAM